MRPGAIMGFLSNSRWAEFKIGTAALYLGLWIGPGAGEKSWEQALAKYIARVEMVKSFHAGVWISCLLYKVFAFSTLQFVAQSKRVPRMAYVAERKA
eukprot:3249210-Karenia_brevis.AAC.1